MSKKTDDTARLTLVLEVEYNLEGTDRTVMAKQLEDLVKRALNDGMLTGITPATVERYEYNVTDEDR